jgi:hypothetical protein
MAFLLPAPLLSLFFLQLGALAPVFLLVQLLLPFLVAGRDLLFAELVGLVFLAKNQPQAWHWRRKGRGYRRDRDAK